MVFMANIKELLKKLSNDIFYNIYRSFMRILGYIVVILVISLAAQRCAKAMTITDNLRTINEANLNYLVNIYDRNDYKNYIISSDYISSGYNGYTNYYLCLTNDELDVSSPGNITSSCSELYRYNSSTNSYSLEKLSDPELKVINSIYYTNSLSFQESKKFFTAILLSIIIAIAMISFLYVFSWVFNL